MDLPDPAAPTMPEQSTKKSKTQRISYTSLFWLFLFGSVVGFFLEGLWCVLRKGGWQNHSATVIGPFCIIYGFGAVAICLLSSVLRGRSLPVQYVVFALTGTAVEYLGSLFQEQVFGSRSWDYSKQFLNIGGRVSLRMTLMWGFLGIIFERFLYPRLIRLMDKMKGKFWSIGCAALSVFMAADLLLSAAAVLRWRDRLSDAPPAENAVERFLDEKYDNETMAGIYSNMVFPGQDGE